MGQSQGRKARAEGAEGIAAMSGVDEEQLGELLSAYIDHELDERETVFVQRLLEEDAGARALLDELQQTVSAVSALPSHSAPHSLAEDLEARLDRSELLVDFSEPADVSGPRRSSWLAMLSVAASVVLSVGGGLWVMRDSVDPEAGRRGDAVAINTPKDDDDALRHQSLRPGGIEAA